jgi:hypothetical protein
VVCFFCPSYLFQLDKPEIFVGQHRISLLTEESQQLASTQARHRITVERDARTFENDTTDILCSLTLESDKRC